jgi:hypothetical protein
LLNLDICSRDDQSPLLLFQTVRASKNHPAGLILGSNIVAEANYPEHVSALRRARHVWP